MTGTPISPPKRALAVSACVEQRKHSFPEVMPVSRVTAGSTKIRRARGARADLRHWAIGVCTGFVLLILAGSALGIWHLRRATLGAADDSETRFALLVAERQRQGLSTMDLALKATRRFLAEIPMTTGEGRRSARRFLGNLKDVLPQAEAIIVYDAAGVPLVSTLKTTPRISSANSEFFQVHQKGASDLFYIGTSNADRIGRPPGLVYSRRLLRSDGGLGGVIAIYVDPRYPSRLFNQVRIGATDRLRVERDDGRLLLSLPAGELESSGREGAPGERGAGFADSILPADPADRISVRRAVPGYPITIELSWSRAGTLAQWRGTVAGIVAAALAGCGLLAVLCALLVRQLRTLDRAENKLKDSRALLQNVVDTVPHALYVKDRAGRLELVNATSARMIHMPADELVGRNIFDLTDAAGLSEQHPARVLETDEEVLSSGKPVEFEADR